MLSAPPTHREPAQKNPENQKLTRARMDSNTQWWRSDSRVICQLAIQKKLNYMVKFEEMSIFARTPMWVLPLGIPADLSPPPPDRYEDTAPSPSSLTWTGTPTLFLTWKHAHQSSPLVFRTKTPLALINLKSSTYPLLMTPPYINPLLLLTCTSIPLKILKRAHQMCTGLFHWWELY